jgi:hypothetical protein
LPKTAPTIVDRPRIALWLKVCATMPLRLLVAPAGSGKTTVAVHYARTRPGNCAYLRLTPGIPGSALITQLGRATGDASVRTYDELLAHLDRLTPTEIIVDNVDGAVGEARDLLSRVYADVGERVTFIYLARSIKAIDVNAARAAGLADVCDETLFAFDAAEVAELARLAGSGIERHATGELLGATHGWALAVAGACRAAAAHQLEFAEALVYWRRTNDPALRELVADALRFVPDAVRRAFNNALSGPLAPDTETLTMLRSHGLFVSFYAQRLALNPLLRFEPDDVPVPTADDVPLATIEMFGRFTMSVDGRSVVWERRRDRQIIQFLAMQPNGRATRADLIATFWPDGDPHLARQSLRTAFCTIRAALAACVGSTNVSHYFVADHVVELKLAHAVISARRFAELFERGQSADTEDDLAAALSYYREAERLYRSGFLAGEPPMTWALAHEKRLAWMYDRISHRLGEAGIAYVRRAGNVTRISGDVA